MSQPKITPVPVSSDTETNYANAHVAGVFDMMGQWARMTALASFASTPLAEALNMHGVVDVPAIVKKEKLAHRYAAGLMRYLVTQGLMLEHENEVFEPTFKGKAALSPTALGFLHFYYNGYGELMRESSALIKGEKKYGTDVTRNPFWVAEGSCMITSSMLDDVPYEVMRRRNARVVVDLGCGSGRFLIELAKRNPEVRAVGVDLAPSAIEAAQRAAAEQGLSDRLSFKVGDCFDLSTVKSSIADVDMFYSFAFEHEGLRDGERFVLDHIDQMGKLFPGAIYLQGEPMLNMTEADGIFYWIHVLSDQGYPRNIPGWWELLSKLQHARLEQVYVPSHRFNGAYFEIHLGSNK